MDSQQEQKLREIIADQEDQLAIQSLELKQKNRLLEIEAALEKIRVKATAMRVSSELAETSAIFLHELNELNINALRIGVGIFDEDIDAMEIWLTTYSDTKEVMRILDYVNLHIHPVFENIIPARKENKPYALTILEGEEVKKYYRTMSTYISLPAQQHYNATEYYYSFFFKEGAINVTSNQMLSKEECHIIIRFTKVFGLIYTRFLDLQKAEARAKDILKQTSLDRVRGQIASMRSMDDLNRITPLIWSELKTLGVPFIRCGVLIIDEERQIVQMYLSAPDGHSLGLLNLPFDANTLTKNLIEYWKNNLVYRQHWTGEDFSNWIQSMLEYGQILNKETYQNATNPLESLDLHFTPFTQGMLYIGNTSQLTDEEIELAGSLAEAFAIAYARYEDFIKLENAKQIVESALMELKATQTQLIHSEKMASLGEMTSGIAHEIQNPLNFVNNFSELNNELIDELMQETYKENWEEVKQIVYNIKENENKINFHGKRADAIVKSMLQHSRSSTGVKEPADINALCDEYLRLSYHGLRAKDKSFNAIMKTDFDPSAGPVNIIPQDIGRVILNLINNAFYAVGDRKKQLAEGYEPTVTVSTKKFVDTVEIRVADNGSGIPKNVVDKIFQPFFTTKPTGQGTGLGLSLSYDIIKKGHGGEIKVETKEGEGTSFIIFIPIP